jgi:hypothetical protein
MSTIPAYTIGSITRPELHLDPSGNIVLDPAAQAFVDTYGLKSLYIGCPPNTPFPPVSGLLLTTPVDTNPVDNSIFEGAAVNTPVNITASAHDIIGLPITYTLTADSSGGGFKIDPHTGVVTVANGNNIDYETSPGHAYSVTVQATDGIFVSSQTFTIGVGNVNEAPAGADKTVTTNEDHAYVFAVADFGFTDPSDSSAPNSLQAVKITTLPAGGVLTNNGVAVAAGSFVSVADINAHQLVFTPAANANGTNYAHFTFQVQDNGGTANGGVDLDQSPNTITINVNAVNDAPSFTNGATQTVLEDTGAHTVNHFVTGISPGPADEAGQTVNFIVTNNAHAMFSVQPSIDASGNLTYTLAANANGSATVSVQAHDNGGTANGGADTSVAQTFTIAVTPVNDAPVGTSNTLTILEDGSHSFTAADFGFTDPADAAGASGANAFQDVIITTIPSGAAGTLTLSGGAVVAGQTIAAANIGNLVFTPAANANGSPEASFTFQVQDNGGTANGGVDTDPTPKTITFNVTPVNDAPSFTAGANQTVLEDAGAQTVVGFATAISAGPADEAGQAVNFVVTGNSNAGLFAVGPAIAANGTLTYTAAANAFGTATITVHAHDNGGTANGGVDNSGDQTFTINVTPVNDAPSFTVGADQSTLEDSGAQTVNGFASNISDGPNETGQTLNFIVSNNNNALFSVQPSIDANGNLTYTPTANANGSATISVTLHDNGGTANGGADTSAAQTFTINVPAVNDPPSFTIGANQVTLEDSGAHTVNGFVTGISPGPADEAGQTVNFLVSNNNTAMFSVQPSIDASGNLTYTLAANANGSATVSVQAHDNGGTANGGVDTSVAQTFTIGATPVNDAPSFTVGTNQTVLEDTGAHTVNGFATGISAGPPDESGQTLNFIVSNNNNALFSVQPTIDASGNLTYTLAADASGSATVSVSLHDNGGTANGGVDTSAVQTFSIGVTPVNDAPSFTVGANQTVLEDSGAHTINGFATGISPGPNEAGQTVNFLTSNNDNALFSVQPTIDASGNLTYTLAANANGTATVSVQIHDNGGTANGGVDTSVAQTFTISAGAVNDAPVGTSNTLTILEDGSHTFTAAEFGFTDPADAASASGANAFQNVIITTIPGALAGTLTLSGGAVAAGQVIAAANLGNLVFTPAANANGSPEASFTFQVQDNGGTANGGVDTDPTPKTMAFNVTSVNDAPAGTDKTIAALGSHTFVAADFGFTDPTDAASAAGANSLLAVEITTVPSSGTLADNGTPVTAGQFITVADINSGLLVFTPTGNSNASFTFQVQDNGGTANGGVDLDQSPNTLTINQDAPPVVTAGHTLSYTENQAATAIDTALTVTDADSANLASATVQITGNYVISEDVLGFTAQNGIIGTFNALTGTMTLTGSASVANYQAALDSVTYVNTSDNPSGAARTVTIIANDGTVDSAPATDTINVTPVNDAPVVTAGHTLNYTENQAATAFDPALTVTDVDSANLASATVQITGNYVNGQDILAFTAQNGITGSFNAATGTMTLTGSSSVANYQAALDSVTYFNNSDNPSGLARTVTIIANDGAANSIAKTDTINVTPVNDAPVTTAGGALNYIENQAATAIDATVTVSDVDSANMASATVQITGNYVNGQDILGFTTQNGITGSFNSGTGTLTLTGSSSVANYKTALDSVTYFNNSDNPSGADRTVSYTVNDGALNSNTSTSTIHVTPVNDPPVVTFGAITGFTEPPNGTPAASSTPVTIAPNLTISDVDSTNLTSATFVLNNLKPLDALSVSGHAGPSGDIGNIHFEIVTAIGGPSNSETVTFTGTDTIAHYNAVLDLVQFNNTSENPDTTARSYTVTAVDDGGGNNTGSANTTETVTAVDDPPTASVPADASVGTAFSHTNLAISGLTVADIDAGSGNVTATISTVHAGLTFDTTGLSSSTNNGTHTVTLTGTVAQVNTALSSLVYNSDDGFTGSDTVTLNVSDNGNTGTGGPLTSGPQTFHVGVVPQVFYIDNNNGGPGNGAGTQADPFHSIAAFNTANPAGAGDYVVLEHGTGTYSEANGINLADGVNLIGGSQTLTFTNPVTGAVVTANTGSGTDPLIKLTAGSADNAIDLLGTTGHTIAHVNVDTTLGSGMGVSDDGNNVGTVAISNMLVDTASGNGMTFTHGGTVTVTGTNHIVTGTGIALDVVNTNIGSSGLTFHNISDNGGSSGIVLNNTGVSGHLTVTGTGTSAGTGGTIQNTTGDAISLTNTLDVSLSDMNINNSAGNGIRGSGVNGIVLSNDSLSGNANANNEAGINLTGLTGSASHITQFTGITVSNSYDHNVIINNTSGTLANLVVTGSTFSNNGLSQHAGSDFNFLGDGTATMTLTATNNTFSGTTSPAANLTADGLHVDAASTSTVNAHIGDGTAGGANTFTNNNVGIDLSVSNTAHLNFDVNENTVTGSRASGINFFANGAPGAVETTNGFILNNTVGTLGVAGSGSILGNGIRIDDEGGGTTNVQIDSNTVQQVGLGDGSGFEAMTVFKQVAQTGTLNATITNNLIRNIPDDAGLEVRNNNTSGTSVMNADVHGNTFTNVNSATEGFIARIGGGPGSDRVNVPQASTAAIEAANTGITSNSEIDPNVHFGQPVPTLPSATPLLAAAGGVQASSPTAGEMNLTQAELDSVVVAAIAGWAAAGASASQLAALQATTFSIGDLSGNIIGQELAPSHITIDTNAAGHGWFIDPTPSDNSEFTHAQNAAGTDLLTDPTTAAAGHLDLLTTVSHEMGHVLGLGDSTSASDVHDLMYINLVDGERRVPDSADVVQANTTPAVPLTPAVSIGPASQSVASSAPGNGTIDAGHGGGTLVGTASADNFVFAHVDVQGPTPPPITHVANYSFAQGDTFDFSALTSQFHTSGFTDAMIVRAVEDPSGQFATLQVDKINPNGLPSAPNWVSVAQIDGAHSGDVLNVTVDSHSAVHLAQIHVDLLV